ncbi:unnamed protein product [Calypogeia fissa]
MRQTGVRRQRTTGRGLDEEEKKNNSEGRGGGGRAEQRLAGAERIQPRISCLRVSTAGWLEQRELGWRPFPGHGLDVTDTLEWVWRLLAVSVG